MGICKCRKKTDLFCFDHKKAVCGDCLDGHEICTINTYRSWLQNPSFTPPTCCSCREPLPSKRPVVRLLCLHVIHTSCLATHLATFSPQTALAGYLCPVDGCPRPTILPSKESDAAALTSVSALRKQLIYHFQSDAFPLVLQTAAHEELGLPPPASLSSSSSNAASPASVAAASPLPSLSSPAHLSSTSTSATGLPAIATSTTPPSSSTTSVSISFAGGESVVSKVASRKQFGSGDSSSSSSSFSSSSSSSSSADYNDPRKKRGATSRDDDHDDDKYRRKSVTQLCQFLGIIDPPTPTHLLNKNRPALSSPRRILLIFILLASLLTFIMIYSLMLSTPAEPIDDLPTRK